MHLPHTIKLVAANYLPSITIFLPHLDPAARKDELAAGGTGGGGGMLAGKTYAFQLSFTNPLYDPIQVRLHVQRTAPLPGSSSGVAGTSASAITSGGEASASGSGERATDKDKDKEPSKTRRPPYAVSLPTAAFPIAAFAEAWEYEDDEEMFVDEDDFDERRGGGGRVKTVGVLERRANVTVVGGEVVIGKEARGEIKVRCVSPVFLGFCA